MSGGSYGGFMSLAVQTTYNDRIKAGIDVVGISNFVTFLKNTQGYRRDLRRAEYGDEREPEMREFLERISPLASASKIHTPILIVQGQNDPRVPISESEQLVAAVKKNGVPGLVRRGQERGPRLRQEGQPGLPPGRRGPLPPPVPAGRREMMRLDALGTTQRRRRGCASFRRFGRLLPWPQPA